MCIKTDDAMCYQRRSECIYGARTHRTVVRSYAPRADRTVPQAASVRTGRETYRGGCGAAHCGAHSGRCARASHYVRRSCTLDARERTKQWPVFAGSYARPRARPFVRTLARSLARSLGRFVRRASRSIPFRSRALSFRTDRALAQTSRVGIA